MRLISAAPLNVTDSTSQLAFTTTGGGSWNVWDRFISLGDTPIAHIGNICDTCEFFFHILNKRPSPCADLIAVRSSLETGLTSLDRVEQFATPLPNGQYIAALFMITPCRAGTTQPDYFRHEQQTLWGRTPWGEDPLETYYRGNTSMIEDGQGLFEFYVPLQDPAHLDAKRIAHYEDMLAKGTQPTCVAIGVLDVKAPATDKTGEEIAPEYHTHWCFANYLLDGHHKVEASHRQQKPITMLTFLTIDHSWMLTKELMQHYGYDR